MVIYNLMPRFWGVESSVTPNISGVKGFIVGGITGGILMLITYPIDFIKTELQMDEQCRKMENIRAKRIDCVMKIVRRHGILGLFRGLNLLAAGIIPINAIRFGCVESFRTLASDKEGKLSSRGHGFCGLGAGAVEAFCFVTPTENIKEKFIKDALTPCPKYRGLLHGIRIVILKEGLRGLYRGLWLNVLSHGLKQGTIFMVMETCKDNYRMGDRSKAVPEIVVGGFGVIAGALGGVVDSPIHVVRKKLKDPEGKRYLSAIDCFMHTCKIDGFRSLYKGVTTRVALASFEAFLTFLIYEHIIKIFK